MGQDHMLQDHMLQDHRFQEHRDEDCTGQDHRGQNHRGQNHKVRITDSGSEGPGSWIQNHRVRITSFLITGFRISGFRITGFRNTRMRSARVRITEQDLREIDGDWELLVTVQGHRKQDQGIQSTHIEYDNIQQDHKVILGLWIWITWNYDHRIISILTQFTVIPYLTAWT